MSFGDNNILNDTDTRKIELLINGDDDDLTKVKLTGIRCIGGCKNDPVEDAPLEDRVRFWSDIKDWDGRPDLPQDGEDIVIPSAWQMMYDISPAASPVLNSLQINGKLTFMPGADRHLKTYNLWVRAGELNIGADGAPFEEDA